MADKLTPNMLDNLKKLASGDTGYWLNQNTMNALARAGMVVRRGASRRWQVTEAGHAALNQPTGR